MEDVFSSGWYIGWVSLPVFWAVVEVVGLTDVVCPVLGYAVEGWVFSYGVESVLCSDFVDFEDD